MKVRHIDARWIEIDGHRFYKQLVRVGSGHTFWGIVNWKPGYVLDLDTWVEREQFDFEVLDEGEW